MARRRDAEERLAEGGLADSGLSGDEGHLPLRGGGVVERPEQPIHLRFTPDKGRKRRARGEVDHRVDDRRDEDVAALDEAANEAGPHRVVAERPANLADEDLDVVGMNVGLGPDGLEQGFLGDHVAGALHEHGKQVEGLVGERNAYAVAPEGSGGQVEPEGRKIFHVTRRQL